jgi:CRISPR/Cas system CMR-associated protein Cmr1 (group 7 of RAMP superfamily)
MRLRYPEWMQEEIEAALWAWEHFGGLGGAHPQRLRCRLARGGQPAHGAGPES